MKALTITATIVAALLLSACQRDAQVASRNLSRAAENFEIDRRIVFYNGITGDYMLTVEGRCMIDARSAQLQVTCKVGPRDMRKHFLGLSDNVTYFAEQLSPGDVNVFHHRITFKPQVIIPDFDFRGSAEALADNTSEVME